MKNKRIPVILDTDIGGDIDDTWAVAHMLKSPELDVKLIVGDCGNPVYRAKLIAKVLERAGRTDVGVGVGIEVPKPVDQPAPEAVDWPEDPISGWVQDYDLTKYPGKVHQDGVQAMIDLIKQSPEPVTLIAIGPPSNLAEMLRRDPSVASKTRFVGMFGSIYLGYDRKPGASAETNVRVDIPASQKVFTAPWLEMVITPLDTCNFVCLEGERYVRVRDSLDPLQASVMENYRIWAKSFEWAKDMVEKQSTILFDTVAVHLAYSTAFLKMQEMGIRVTDDGFTVVDSHARKVNVAIDWTNLEAYYDDLEKRLLR